tara:strand:+ start:605 stop:772 length:168 start_codon:yes stop_codon:yes gene_type:complete
MHIPKVFYQNTIVRGLKVALFGFFHAQMTNGWNGWTMMSFGNLVGGLNRNLTRIE